MVIDAFNGWTEGYMTAKNPAEIVYKVIPGATPHYVTMDNISFK